MTMQANEMVEGNRYRLEPNENYKRGAELIWYEIEVLEMSPTNVYFKVLRSNAEHTEGKNYTFPFTSQIFKVRDVIPLRTFRHMEVDRQLREREERLSKESMKEKPRPISEYELSTNFKKVLIDIALMDNDEEWFKELTGASKVS